MTKRYTFDSNPRGFFFDSPSYKVALPTPRFRWINGRWTEIDREGNVKASAESANPTVSSFVKQHWKILGIGAIGVGAVAVILTSK